MRAGLERQEFGVAIDVLWMGISKKQEDPQQSLGFFQQGKLLVLLDRGEYWQCGFVIPKGGFDEIDFRLELAHKDIRQAADLAREATTVPMSVASAAEALFRLGCAEGFGKQDWTAIVRGLERGLGAEFRAPTART